MEVLCGSQSGQEWEDMKRGRIGCNVKRLNDVIVKLNERHRRREEQDSSVDTDKSCLVGLSSKISDSIQYSEETGFKRLTIVD